MWRTIFAFLLLCSQSWAYQSNLWSPQNGGIGPTASGTSTAVRMSHGTTGQRPASPVDGFIRYNTTLNRFEAYENGSWKLMIAALSGDVVADANGVTTIQAGAVALVTDVTGTLPKTNGGTGATAFTDLFALGTDTTGDYVATVADAGESLIAVAGSGSETAAVTLTLGTVIDLGGRASLEVPNAAAPTTDAFGEIAGDDNAWGAGRGAIQAFDGTANTYLVGALASDSPANGQVPTWGTGGTITWETPSVTAPGGADSHVQYNDGGALSGETAFAWDDTNDRLTIGTTPLTAKLSIDASGANVTPLKLKTNGAAGNYTPTNSGVFIYDAAGTEIFRLYASDPDWINNYNSGNLYVGAEAGFSQPTGNNAGSGFYNAAFGFQAMRTNLAGSNNSSFGFFSMFDNTSGSRNSGFGKTALGDNTTGGDNSALGFESLRTNTTGSNNSANGASGLYYNTTGARNTSAGYAAGYNPTGDTSPFRIVADTDMVLLGYGATKNNASTLTNGIAIGSGARVLASNQAVLGNDSVTTTLLKGSVGIGDTTPDTSLDVLSSAAADTQVRIANTNAGNADPVMQFELTEGSPLFTLGVDDSDSDAFVIAAGSTLGTTNQMRIAGSVVTFGPSENVVIGAGTAVGTSGVKVLLVENGTAPSSSPADAFQFYSADQAAGNACAFIRTENGAIVKLFQGAAVADAAGGVVIDIEARAALNDLLARMRANGLIAP